MEVAASVDLNSSYGPSAAAINSGRTNVVVVANDGITTLFGWPSIGEGPVSNRWRDGCNHYDRHDKKTEC
jgi:hypothetical protein